MRHWMSALGMALAVVLGASCVAGSAGTPTTPATGAQPYAGLETRPIKALAPERVEDLLAGRGAGYALAAELNHYPGPTHVLELRSELQLRPYQEQRVREILSAMQQEARQHGKQLVNLEAELDQDFGTATISPPELARLTGEIAAVEGRLRNTHLAAHLEMQKVLTPDQVAHYDRLRGYAARGEQSPFGDTSHPMDEHQGLRQH